MHILYLNKYLYPKGGSETHMLALADAVRRLGFSTQFFGTEHPDNVTPPETTTTIPATAYSDLVGAGQRLSALADMLYCRQARQALQELLSRSRPDVAHLHNVYHQLSPSVLHVLRRARIPIVLTAHDYKLVCPSYSFYDGQSPCFRCRGHRYWQVVRTGCSRRGLAGDLALMVESYLHHFFRLYEQWVDLVVAPSRFLRDQLVAGGFPQARIVVLPNALDLALYKTDFVPGEYVLFTGRLTGEKGLPTLLEAAGMVPEVPVVVAGDGPLREQVQRRAATLPNVRFMGFVPPARLVAVIRKARALVLPSYVPENCPVSVLEALAMGKPVIASQVGGLPELVQTGRTGILVAPGQATALAEAMARLWLDGWACRRYGAAGRQAMESRHSLGNYTQQMAGIYRQLARSRAAAGAPGTASAAGQLLPEAGGQAEARSAQAAERATSR